MVKREFRLASCEGKERFTSYHTALAVVRKMNRSHDDAGVSFECYRCKVCGGVHIGSYDPLARRSKFKKKKVVPEDKPGCPGHESEVVY